MGVSSFLRIIFISALFIVLPVQAAVAAWFPLEITNIKPAGTGQPAIPTTNRIFRAYPGIEYNIRAAVIGGKYPYYFSLENEPAGMTVDERTGEITWPAPQSSASNIRLVVRDSSGASMTTSWSITVSTAGFIFVDANYSGPEAGTLSQPYRSLASFLQNTLGQTNDIVYFRNGTYQLLQWNASGPATNISNNPATWIAFPGERVQIDGNQRRIAAWNPFYFDGLHINNVVDYGIITTGRVSYKTIRRSVFSNLTVSDSTNNNYGFIHTANDGPGYYFVIQDNEFRSWQGGSAIGSLYNDKKALIENNYIHDTKGGSPTGINNGIAPKYYSDYLTIRGNRIIMSSGTPLSHYMNSSFYDANHIEISYNLFMQTGSGGTVHQWHSHGRQGPTYYYRNTAIGSRHEFRFDPCSGGGPFHFYDNVLVHEVNGINRNCVNASNNVEGRPSDGVVDSNGNLTSGYSQYFGTHGYQQSGSAKAPVPPSGVRFR